MAQVDDALQLLRSMPQTTAQIIANHQQQQRAINSNNQFSASYKQQQLSALRQQTQGALENLHAQAQTTAASARAMLAAQQPKYDQSALDSAWNKATPLLNQYDPGELAGAMPHLVAHSPEMRASLRQNLPLYVRGRVGINQPERTVQAYLFGAENALSTAEAPYLSQQEALARQQASQLDTGMQFLEANHNTATGALHGEPSPYLYSFDKGDAPIEVAPPSLH